MHIWKIPARAISCTDCSRAHVSARCLTTQALLHRVQSSSFLCVFLVSSCVLFFTEFSRALVSARCLTAHACFYVQSGVELFSLYVAGQLTRALLYRLQSGSCFCEVLAFYALLELVTLQALAMMIDDTLFVLVSSVDECYFCDCCVRVFLVVPVTIFHQAANVDIDDMFMFILSNFLS